MKRHRIQIDFTVRGASVNGPAIAAAFATYLGGDEGPSVDLDELFATCGVESVEPGATVKFSERKEAAERLAKEK